MPTLAPQINVTLGVTPTPRARPAVDATAAVVGISRTGPATGPITPSMKLHDAAAWIARHAGGSLDEGRLNDSVDYDGIEEYFADGGSGAGLYYSRVVGPNPAYAKWNIAGTSGTTLEAIADEYGDLPNEKRLQIVNGPSGSTHRVIRLQEADGTIIDQTPEFNDRTAVNGYKLDDGGNTPVTIKLGAGTGLPPVAAAAGVSVSGTDDHANITQTQIDAALARLDVGLGNLNVAAPNWGTPTVGTALLNHAFIFNRFACIDTVDTAVKATVLTQANALQGLANGEHGTLVTPWINIPALSADGTPRAVPGSFLQLAKWAEVDAEFGPNQAAAGNWGVSRYAVGVRATYATMPKGSSDADQLANAGVTLIRLENEAVAVFDNLTLVKPDGNERDLLQNNNVRYIKHLVWEFTNAGADQQFAKVTRDGLAAWKVIMEGFLLEDFQNGDLFPDDDDPRASTAFYVNTGGSKTTGPNSAATINAGQSNAEVGVRPTKGGRIINIKLSTVGLTTPLN